MIISHLFMDTQELRGEARLSPGWRIQAFLIMVISILFLFVNHTVKSDCLQLPLPFPSFTPSLLSLSLSLSLSVDQHLRSTNSGQHFDIGQFITDNYGFSNLHWFHNKYLLLDFEITLIPTINLQESSIYFSEKSGN